MPTETSARRPVAFIHGLWLHAESWHHWLEFFRAAGYEAAALSWPGDGATTAATRANAAALAGYGVTEIAEHLAAQIRGYAAKPIVIGHSFGGMLAQNLLAGDLAAAAVAIDPAPIKGVAELPGSVLKASFPVLGNPFNVRRAVTLTEAQFRFAFANAVSEAEAKALYAQYHMPAPGRPLFQAATATFNPNAATKVNTANATRGPLLLMAGTADNTVPPVLVHSAYKRYQGSGAVTELIEIAGRGHSLTIDSGWRAVAQTALDWLRAKGL